MIKISEETNQILNVVKAKYNLKDKSEAIDYVTKEYSQECLEPELRPEFVERIVQRQQEKTVKVNDFKQFMN